MDLLKQKAITLKKDGNKLECLLLGMQQKILLKCYEKKRLGSLEIFHHKAIFHYFLCPNTYYVLRSICFSSSEISLHVFSNNASPLVTCAVLEDYVNNRVSSLKQFNSKGNTDQESNIPSLAALSSAMQLITGYVLSPS